MTGPAWLADLFAAESAAVTLYCAGHLVASRLHAPRLHAPSPQRGVHLLHVAMGAVMAGMLLDVDPARRWDLLAGGAFAAAAAWFAARDLAQLATCAAMAYMLLAPALLVSSSAGLLVAVLFTAVLVWSGASSAGQLALSFTTGRSEPVAFPAARLAHCCQVAMCAAMAYMLLAMA